MNLQLGSLFYAYKNYFMFAMLYCMHAELYMVQDKSRDFLDTWDFLETRISDIKDLGKIYDDVSITFLFR